MYVKPRVYFEFGVITGVTLENIAEAVLKVSLATEEELCETIDELYQFVRNSHTVLGGPCIYFKTLIHKNLYFLNEKSLCLFCVV
jgi:hypothetical protein